MLQSTATMNATSIVLERYMCKRPGSSMWQLRKPVPADVQAAFGQKVYTESLGTRDDRQATKVALSILEKLDEQWSAIRRGVPLPSIERDSMPPVVEPSEDTKQAVIRATFEQVVGAIEARDNGRFLSDRAAYEDAVEKRRKSARELNREVRMGNVGRFVAPTEKLLSKRGVNVDHEAPWFHVLVRDVATAVLDAQNVAIKVDEGELDPQPTTDVVKRAFQASEFDGVFKDVRFSELADLFMRQWLAGRSNGKATNTEQQKRATFRLFGGFFHDRPIRQVRHADAANFFDEVRLLDPHWARSPDARKLTWQLLVGRHGGRDRGLSDATMNRHLQVLQELWLWAKKRGHCEGENPFEGFHKKLRAGVNVKPYLPWEDDELRRLLTPTPKRSDLLEVILVGMFTGMRLDEIASLTWSQIRSVSEADTVISYFQVEDAKTPAGNRKVPVHRDLQWLLSRKRGPDDARVWPTFNEEGPGSKPGADAGREFSRFKMSRGFHERSKAFHSFRKNVTRMMERAGVPENDWAQIFGHERGFTYRVYNPDGIDMVRRAEIIALISYPGIELPHPTR